MKTILYALMLLPAVSGCSSMPPVLNQERPQLSAALRKPPANLLQMLDRLITISEPELSLNNPSSENSNQSASE